jgi:hypothetical protein
VGIEPTMDIKLISLLLLHLARSHSGLTIITIKMLNMHYHSLTENMPCHGQTYSFDLISSTGSDLPIAQKSTSQLGPTTSINYKNLLFIKIVLLFISNIFFNLYFEFILYSEMS